MLKNIKIAAFLLISTGATAQTTVTNTYFPSVGDSLKVATALPNLARFSLRVTPAGTNQNWDYSFLRSRVNSTLFNTTVYRTPPANDTVLQRTFPTASMVTYQDSLGVSMACYQKTATRFDLMGFKGFSAFGGLNLLGGVRVSPTYVPFALERRAPLTFGSAALRTQSNFTVTIPASALPDTLLALFPIRPDSIRTRFQTVRNDQVDAWGTVRIPGASYSVLREKRVETEDTKIEVRLPNLPIWIDVTSALSGTGGFLPQDTTISFRFWANGVKEPILVLTVDNTRQDSVTNADYKYLPINTATENPSHTGGGAVWLQISPNPTDGIVQLDWNKMEAGNFILQFYDLNGTLVETKQQFLEKKTILDCSNLADGFYILQVQNADKMPIGVAKFLKN